jgi:hypothetical protein
MEVRNLKELKIKRAREDYFYIDNIPGYKDTVTPLHIKECYEIVKKYGYISNNFEPVFTEE